MVRSASPDGLESSTFRLTAVRANRLHHAWRRQVFDYSPQIISEQGELLLLAEELATLASLSGVLKPVSFQKMTTVSNRLGIEMY